MLAVFEGMLPVFLLIVLGALLRNLRFMPDGAWSGMDRLVFYCLLPTLLFTILYRTDFASLELGSLSAVFFIGILVILVLGVFARRPAQTLLGIDGPSFSSLYQGFGRWNGFIALAVVEKLYGGSGLATVAIALAVMVIPINLFNIGVVTWLGAAKPGARQSFIWRLATNPLIGAAVLGLGLNYAQISIYSPIIQTAELISRATLPIGIMLVGAGLRFHFDPGELGATIVGTVLKLVAVPLVFVGLGVLVGISGETLQVIAVCGGVPTAMAGYAMASQMGGNAPLMAAITSAQTLLSFITVPLLVQFAQQF